MRAGLLLAALALLALPAAPALPGGPSCVPLMSDAASVLGATPDAHPCTGLIRPGAPLGIEHAWGCTLAFIVRDEAGALYAATAGHCIPPGARSIVVAGVGDIGDAHFTRNAGVGNDFALVAIDPAKYALVEPSMCHWGGPVAGDQQTPPRGPALHYGWGYLWGQQAATRARGAVVAGAYADHVTFLGEVSPGDSGSPIQSATGEALGIVTHTVIVPGPAPIGGGLGFATRLGHGLALAGAATGRTYTLVTGVAVDPTGLSVP